MKAFTSADQMLDAHELMFGEAGRQCAATVVKWATTLFAVPLEVLNIRVVLAPVELGPYNRHAGYCYGGEGKAALILGNRHIVQFSRGTLVLDQSPMRFEDFIVHELTHIRQAQLLRENGWQMKRGAHRDLGWYSAIAEACPRYLGCECPRSSWPTGPRLRKGDNRLTEVEMTHWPASLATICQMDDPRLPKVTRATQQLMCKEEVIDHHL